jgi:ADP-ribosylglycohydrolase
MNFSLLAERYGDDVRAAGLLGLLVGDAAGVPYEFNLPQQLPAPALIDMVPPPAFHRTYGHLPPGTWSDDGAQALCLLESLVEHQGLHLEDFAARLLRWADHGHLAVDGDVFDIGIQTARAMHRLRGGASPLVSGSTGERECGNGSLMRVLPLALWHAGPDDALVRDAHRQSLPTHAHARNQAVCAYYCLVARGYLQRHDNPWDFADRRLGQIYRDWPHPNEAEMFLAELDVVRRFPALQAPSGSGYVVDTLWSARAALEEPSFEGVIRAAILLGQDTDTTACVAGGLAGIRFGSHGIPARWLAQMRGAELVLPLLTRLCAEARA